MGVLECTRIVLYLIEWIWTTVVLGIFPDQLKSTAGIHGGGSTTICNFNMNVGSSRCDFGTAWAAIAFVVLTATVIWYCLEYCTTLRLPGNVEVVIFSWLTLWWFVGAIALSATKSGKAPSTANVPVAFAWMLFLLCAVSTFIGSRAPKQVEFRRSDDNESRSDYQQSEYQQSEEYRQQV